MPQPDSSKRTAFLIYLLFAVFGLCLGSATLFFASQPINVAAYWLGYGTPQQVVVTEGSSSFSFTRGDPGEGRAIADNSTIRLYDVEIGETVTARPRLIDFGANSYAFHNPLSAAADLMYLIPTALFGFPFTLLLLGIVAPARLHRITEWLKNRTGNTTDPARSTPQTAATVTFPLVGTPNQCPPLDISNADIAEILAAEDVDRDRHSTE